MSEQPVPMEPTDEMVRVGTIAISTLSADIEFMPDTVAVLVWKAMYNAAFSAQTNGNTANKAP